MQQFLSTQDAKFEAFTSYMIEALMSLRTNMNVNHEAIMARINHLIYAHEDDSHHYESFYREMYEINDSQYRNEGPSWYRGAPRGHGRR